MRTNLKDILKAIALIVLVAILLAPFAGIAQTVKHADKELKDTVIRGNSFKLMQGSRGGKYYLKTSAKGNVYKVYIKSK